MRRGNEREKRQHWQQRTNKQTNKQAEEKGVLVKINEKQAMMLKDSNCVFCMCVES